MKEVYRYNCGCGGKVYIELEENRIREIPCPRCYWQENVTTPSKKTYDEIKEMEVYTQFDTVALEHGEKIKCIPGEGIKVTLDDNGIEV